MCLVSGFQSVAQLIDINLVVLNYEGKKFTLYVNDVKVNEVAQINVKVFHIHEGWCKLKAEFEEGNISITDSIKIKPIEKNKFKEITLSISLNIKNGNKSAKFEFIGIGDASGPEIPLVPEIPVYLSKLTENAVFGNLYQIKDTKPVFLKNIDSITHQCKVILNDKDIENFLFLISKTNDFANRKIYAEKTILYNCFSTTQLIRILNTLEIEMDKLKLSKKAFPNLTDKENSKSVVSVFKFKTMTDDYFAFLKMIDDEKKQKSLSCNQAVPEPVFNELYLQVIKGKHEHDKFANAKSIVLKNCLTSAQAKKILDVFSHDREKIELAKMTYQVITDKENYKILADCFMFSENKNDFLNYISK